MRPGSRAATNYGTAPDLLVDQSSEKNFLLRFDLTGIGTATIANATLRLYVLDSSSSGGNFFTTTDTTWNENTLTWNTAPAADGTPLSPPGRVLAGTWIELDVTPFISGDGPLSIRVSSTNRNGADYASKENANGNAPQLIVTLS